MSADIGPYETWDQAARAVPGSGAGDRLPNAQLNFAHLSKAVELAGVELGAHDSGILWWLAGLEPEAVAVVAGLIRRAAGEASTDAAGTDGPT